MSSYYACFNNEKNIITITNDISSYENYVQIDASLAEDFLHGKKYMSDYYVKHNHLNIFSIEKKQNLDSADVFKDLVSVKMTSGDDDLNIKHDVDNNYWIFKLSENIKPAIDHTQYEKLLKFYVVKSNQYNCLYNTLEVLVKDLIHGEIVIEFKSNKERELKNVSILTKKYFDKIGISQ
jgi:hypothetical protein